jgi:hypothetical protein
VLGRTPILSPTPSDRRQRPAGRALLARGQPCQSDWCVAATWPTAPIRAAALVAPSLTSPPIAISNRGVRPSRGLRRRTHWRFAPSPSTLAPLCWQTRWFAESRQRSGNLRNAPDKQGVTENSTCRTGGPLHRGPPVCPARPPGTRNERPSPDTQAHLAQTSPRSRQGREVGKEGLPTRRGGSCPARPSGRTACGGESVTWRIEGRSAASC